MGGMQVHHGARAHCASGRAPNAAAPLWSGVSPETSLPSADRRDSSRRIEEAERGVGRRHHIAAILQPDADIADDPGVSPRSNSERPNRQMSSRSLVSLIATPRFSPCLTLWQHGQAVLGKGQSRQEDPQRNLKGTPHARYRKTACRRDRARLDGLWHGDLAARAGFEVTGCDVSADSVARFVERRRQGRRRRRPKPQRARTSSSAWSSTPRRPKPSCSARTALPRRWPRARSSSRRPPWTPTWRDGSPEQLEATGRHYLDAPISRRRAACRARRAHHSCLRQRGGLREGAARARCDGGQALRARRCAPAWALPSR